MRAAEPRRVRSEGGGCRRSRREVPVPGRRTQRMCLRPRRGPGPAPVSPEPLRTSSIGYARTRSAACSAQSARAANRPLSSARAALSMATGRPDTGTTRSRTACPGPCRREQGFLHAQCLLAGGHHLLAPGAHSCHLGSRWRTSSLTPKYSRCPPWGLARSLPVTGKARPGAGTACPTPTSAVTSAKQAPWRTRIFGG
jgi:hypothetical protein